MAVGAARSHYIFIVLVRYGLYFALVCYGFCAFELRKRWKYVCDVARNLPPHAITPRLARVPFVMPLLRASGGLT